MWIVSYFVLCLFFMTVLFVFLIFLFMPYSVVFYIFFFFFFKQKTAYEMRISDWSSDVCSSDLGEESRLGPLLVHRAAAHDRLPETGALDHLALERRRRPFGGIELLDVVHEIDAERARSADIDRPEDAGMAVGRNDLDIGEARILGKLGHIGRALGHAAVFGGDRGEGDPVADALDRRGLAGFGGLADIRHRSRLRPERYGSDERSACPQHGGAANHVAAVQLVDVTEIHAEIGRAHV